MVIDSSIETNIQIIRKFSHNYDLGVSFQPEFYVIAMKLGGKENPPVIIYANG